MVLEQKEPSPSIGSDIGESPDFNIESSVFVLVVYRDGNPTTVHTNERRATEAAADLSDDEDGTLEDRFARAQRLVSDEGGVMEIVSSPVFGG